MGTEETSDENVFRDNEIYQTTDPRTSGWLQKKKKKSRHIIFKLLKSKNKDIILKAFRQSENIT